MKGYVEKMNKKTNLILFKCRFHLVLKQDIPYPYF